MEVEEFEKKIIDLNNKWEKKLGVTFTEQTTFNHIVEEVGELARQFVNRDARKDKFNDKEVDDAIGDILFQTFELAHLRGIKVEKLIKDIIEEGSKRLLE